MSKTKQLCFSLKEEQKKQQVTIAKLCKKQSQILVVIQYTANSKK